MYIHKNPVLESGRKDNEGNDGFFAGLIPKDNWFTQMLNTFFGSRHVRIANFSAIFDTCFHKQAGEMHGARELGTRPGIPVGSLLARKERCL